MLKTATFYASFEKTEDTIILFGDLDFTKSRPFYLESDGGNGQVLLSILSLFESDSYDIFVGATNKVSDAIYTIKKENVKPDSSREVKINDSEKFIDLRFIVSGLTNGQPYYIVIRGRDKNGNLSQFSNWTKAIPNYLVQTRLFVGGSFLNTTFYNFNFLWSEVVELINESILIEFWLFI